MSSRSTHAFQGAEAECAFSWRAMQHGLIVSKPLSNTTYDFVVQARARGKTSPAKGAPLLRVQVKSTRTLFRELMYQVNTIDRGRGYSWADLDFFAVWIVPFDAWYIVPSRFIGRDKSVSFFPHHPKTRSKYERFREAWQLLTAKKKT